MSRHFFTIGRKFGLLYLLLVAVIAAVGGVVLLNVEAMRADSGKLLEETREAAVVRDLVVQLESLWFVIRLRTPPLPLASHLDATLRDRLAAVRRTLGNLHDENDGPDPSRVEHQAAEVSLASRISTGLDAIGAALASELTDDVRAEVLATLERAHRDARVLDEETRHEAVLANDDLVALARRSTRAVIATLVACGTALCLALWLVLRIVVRPIQRLRAGADQLGAGALERRIKVRNRDEIGDLARSFNLMAERVAGARDALEDQVRARTRQLLRTARLADLGTLAAGLAHEINNPLGSIASCAEGLERRLCNGPIDQREVREYLQTIAGEAWRARDITGRLLALARTEPGPVGDVDLALVCQQLQLMVRHQFESRRIDLAIEKPDPLPELRGNAGEITQVLVNLLLNAKDASPPGSTVRLRCCTAGDRVVFEVADQGPGIADEDMERIFDPFYTSKEPGHGTGLGLALVATIVQAHGGQVDVENLPEGGARFRVAWPRRAEHGSA